MPKSKSSVRTVPITMRALIQRINRALKKENEFEVLKITRGRWRGGAGDLGRYYTVDENRNAVTGQHIDPEKLGRKLGVLKDYEHVAD